MSDQALDTKVLTHLKNLCGGEPTFLNELIDLFKNDSFSLIKHLETAIQTKNRVNEIYYSHRLKGLCANIGAKELKKTFEKIELNGIEYDRREQLISSIDEKLRRTVHELNVNWRS
jgi:HPt (histidine-containing phosphotransfer) domain-containing protein